MPAEFWCLALGRPGDFSTAIHGPSVDRPCSAPSMALLRNTPTHPQTYEQMQLTPIFCGACKPGWLLFRHRSMRHQVAFQETSFGED